MKISRLVTLLLMISFFACNNANQSDDHGHEHGPDGEHLHEHGEEGHTHDDHHEQEVFEVGKDTMKMDSLSEGKHKEDHTHGDHSHNH